MTPALDEESRRVVTRQMDAYDKGAEARRSRASSSASRTTARRSSTTGCGPSPPPEWPRDERLRYVPARSGARPAGLDAMKGWPAPRRRCASVSSRCVSDRPARCTARRPAARRTDASGAYPSTASASTTNSNCSSAPASRLRGAAAATSIRRSTSAGSTRSAPSSRQARRPLLLDADPLADIRNTRRSRPSSQRQIPSRKSLWKNFWRRGGHSGRQK